MSCALKVSSATVRYGGVAAIDDLSFHHENGGVVGLIGPNGAGKTTLLNVLSGAVRLTTGKISLQGRDLTSRKPHQIARLGITRTFQNLQVFGSLSVLDNVLLPRVARGWATAVGDMVLLPQAHRKVQAERARALDLLDQVGIAEYAKQPAGSLPYGLQRRVEIARALAGDPELILLDEPLAGLSASESVDLTELFTKVSTEGITVLLVEHDVASVLSVSKRVLVLDHGRLLADGTPDEVSADPAVRAAYLGEEWT
ncbi:ABC transporter ATP-binding protein [Actinocatenispora sera]|uniref:ABC transporter ATP-binding protein n=1 Tax=Actinocatenispora sera TaxID=390989 RepID=UPI0033FDCBA7